MKNGFEHSCGIDGIIRYIFLTKIQIHIKNNNEMTINAKNIICI